MTWADSMFFAPEILVDAKGRRIMWAWLHDQRSGKTRNASGWSGTMSLPRTLWLGEDNTLRMRPAKELAALRYNARKFGPGTILDHRVTLLRDNVLIEMIGSSPLKAASGNSIELSLEMKPGKGTEECGVKVCCSPDGKEQTLVYYDATDKKLKIDTRESSLGEGPKRVEAAPFELKEGETLKLRIFVDKSVVEVFANDRQALVRRIYPTRKDSVGVELFSIGGTTNIPRLDAWDMMPSNPH